MVLPNLEYANLFLSGRTKLKKIQQVQNRNLKNILNKDRMYSTRLLHKDAKLASWEVRARLSAMRLMFKYKFDENNLEHISCNTRIQTGPVLGMEQPQSDKYLRSISHIYIARKEWKMLPAEIRWMSDYSFKSRIKTLYRESTSMRQRKA